MPRKSIATKTAGLIYGQCHVCEDLCAAPPIKVPDLTTLKWGTAYGDVLYDLVRVCSKRTCVDSLLQRYRAVLRRGLQVNGTPVPPERAGENK